MIVRYDFHDLIWISDVKNGYKVQVCSLKIESGYWNITKSKIHDVISHGEAASQAFFYNIFVF